MNRRTTRHHRTNGLLTLILAAVGVSAACGGDQQTEAAASEPPSTEASAVHGEQPPEPPQARDVEAMKVGYTCADDKSFTISLAGEDAVVITIDGEAHTLALTEGHSGRVFSGDGIVVSSQGREASVQIDGEPAFTDCQAQGHP